MSKLTLTEAIHENQLKGETMTQCLHRLRTPEETMTECEHKMTGIDGEGTSVPVFVEPIRTSGITDTSAKLIWLAADGQVDNYRVNVTLSDVDISGSPFTMAGGTLKKVVSGLTPSTLYEFTVTAINENGEDTSNALGFSTAA